MLGLQQFAIALDLGEDEWNLWTRHNLGNIRHDRQSA